MNSNRGTGLVDRFTRAGQGQVFAFYDRLDAAQRESLLRQAGEIDLAEVDRLFRTVGPGAAAADASGLEPAPYVPLPEHGGKTAEWTKARAAGETALRAGRVAALTVAGGQGTRLGYDGPKGTFPVTPVRRKPLFQVFAEKIAAAGTRYGVPLHWFIMTSQQNHEATEGFFAENKFFGLDAGRVHFFRQGRVPAVDFQGKIMLEAPDTIALSPDGHGGSLRALARSGSLDLMRGERIDTISYFQVDNPLVRCIDPAFIGWHLGRNSEMTSKMVPKAYPEEKVGVFCERAGRVIVMEYSDLPVDLQRQTDAAGQLRFVAGSIAIHLLDRDFVQKMAAPASVPQGGTRQENVMPFHRAEKKIATVDAAGAPVKPAKANGIKFELFVFDALPFARNPVVIETRRADDFSPVKNAEGVDSPQTCRDDQLRQFGRWIRANGAGLPVDASGLPPFAIEVAPHFGYDEDSFQESWTRPPRPPEIRENLYLG